LIATITAIVAGLNELQNGQHVAPRLDENDEMELALVGFSMSTTVGSHVANLAPTDPQIPTPKVLVLHEPAGYKRGMWIWWLKTHLPLEPGDLDDIDPDTRLVLLIAEQHNEDEAPGELPHTPAKIWNATPQIAADNRIAWTIPDLDDGPTVIPSDHLGTQTHEQVNGIDWYGYWLPTTAAIGNLFGPRPWAWPTIDYMGIWQHPDGTTTAQAPRYETPGFE